MTYKIGTRVKKVKGEDVGLTGVVCEHNGECDTIENCHADGLTDYDVYIRIDQPTADVAGWMWPAGSVFVCRSFQWEPIVPEGQAPSEYSFDKLMDECKQDVYKPEQCEEK